MVAVSDQMSTNVILDMLEQPAVKVGKESNTNKQSQVPFIPALIEIFYKIKFLFY